MNFVDLIPVDKREFVKEVLDNTVLTEEEKDTVIRPIVSQDVWNEYQQWKQTRILKDRLPFLSETENEAQQSVILEVVHDKSLSEEKREELLRNLLSPADFQRFLEWKPSNIAMNPDSFLRLLDENMRSMVQRRLEAHDLDAVEIYMTKLANEEAKTVYLEWKAQIGTQMSLIKREDGHGMASMNGETKAKVEMAVDLNGNRPSFEGMIQDLQKNRTELQQMISFNREQSSLLRSSSSDLFPFDPIQTLQRHHLSARMASDSLVELLENVRSRVPEGTIELSVETETVSPMMSSGFSPVDNLYELRKKFREDAMNTYLANRRLTEAAKTTQGALDEK